LLGRRPEPLQELAASYNARVYLADVRNAAAVESAAHDFLTKVGTPDIVIGSAGISVGTLTQERQDLRIFQAVMDANVMGLVHTFHPFIQAMSEKGVGRAVRDRQYCRYSGACRGRGLFGLQSRCQGLS